VTVVPIMLANGIFLLAIALVDSHVGAVRYHL